MTIRVADCILNLYQSLINMTKDIEWKEYLSDDERYADIINGIGCGGKQIITGADLYELDTQSGFLSGPRFIEKRMLRKGNRKIKIRDMLRRVAFGVNFAIIGIENQEGIDYSMPLSNITV